MAKDDEPYLYYVAGVLMMCNEMSGDSINSVFHSKIYGHSFQLSKLSELYLLPDSMDGQFSNETLMELAVKKLVQFGYAEITEDRFGPTMFTVVSSLETSGDLAGFYISPLEELGNKFPESVFRHSRKYGAKWLANAIDKINITLGCRTVETASENYNENEKVYGQKWEPLSIDRKTLEFEETIAGIEQAIREIATDNGFSSTFPAERNNIVDHATATAKSVKEGKVTRKQITEHLIVAGKWVASKFTGSAIGLAGKSLMIWGLKLLGLL